ncbi:circularly permuted type 2 ATP-grasp protein [Rhodoferax sp.]|uniref:circularly permuted type 2 ATP-grasp protein n=1 Tax=Rhodoferax sp. TaxID=50421 RepID=UPI0025F2E840|nr:circularly permuted type 2 ATP-grasp protein [Rhodoferax sp.]
MSEAFHLQPKETRPKPVSVTELAQATQATVGHFDELRGKAAGLSDAWHQFFSTLDNDAVTDMDQRAVNLARQVRDNGITYNVYADENGPQRPWSLDLFPLIVDPQSWQRIEAGVLQRMRLLERVMADVYGPQTLLHDGFLPPALVHAHPGYLRAMHGVKPVGGRFLHIAAFDLARGPDGNWWVEAQRSQAPSGLGYLLENRLAISAQFPRAFQSLRVQRLASTYRALMDSLKAMSPQGADAHLALLTPGPYNETYFEHAYLARYLGLTLVEGSDLLVRDECLFLKTLKGLVPVHGLLKRVDDQYLDPLELRADSTLGVPGLLQAIRAGNVLVANAPGSAFLESPALLGFLPALSRHLLGQQLSLPALPTWWCGERSAMEEALPRLNDCAIKPTYPGSVDQGSFESVLGNRLTPREVDEWAGRIVRHAEEYTLQGYTPLSQMPTWQATGAVAAGQAGKLLARSVMLRVFVVSDGAQGWRVLPGGLARVASAGEEITSMQRGGSSADVWSMTRGEVDHSTLLAPHLTPESLMQRKRMITSRAAENLFWLGRYTERAENAIRLARLTLECLHGEEQSSAPLLTWLSQMAVANTLVLPGVPSALQAPRVFERSLIDGLGTTTGATSVGYYLRALKMVGSSVRERLSQEHWRIIIRCEEDLFARCAQQRQRADFSALQALQILKDTSDHMAAITGAQTDRMTRDDGWRLLSIGRHIERLGFLSSALLRGLDTGSLLTDGGFDAMVELFDSAITFHAQFQQSRDMTALVDLLVIDRDNPRSISWIAHTLRGRLARLAGSEPNQLCALSHKVPHPGSWSLAQLCDKAPDLVSPAPESDTVLSTGGGAARYELLKNVLYQCSHASFVVSDEISTTYFTHSGLVNQSLGAS